MKRTSPRRPRPEKGRVRRLRQDKRRLVNREVSAWHDDPNRFNVEALEALTAAAQAGDERLLGMDRDTRRVVMAMATLTEPGTGLVVANEDEIAARVELLLDMTTDAVARLGGDAGCCPEHDARRVLDRLAAEAE